MVCGVQIVRLKVNFNTVENNIITLIFTLNVFFWVARHEMSQTFAVAQGLKSVLFLQLSLASQGRGISFQRSCNPVTKLLLTYEITAIFF